VVEKIHLTTNLPAGTGMGTQSVPQSNTKEPFARINNDNSKNQYRKVSETFRDY
jgi:hypothetical protein